MEREKNLISFLEHKQKNEKDVFLKKMDENRKIFDEVENKDFLSFLEKSEKVNEGSNGIILKLKDNNGELFERIREIENKEGVKTENEKAIKLLKVNSFEELKKEFENLKEVFSIINSQKNKNDFCRIPFPIFLKEIEVEDKELKEKLKKQGIKNLQSKLGMMTMEYVPGEDLFNFLAKRVIDKHNKKDTEEFSSEYLYNEDTQTEEFVRDLGAILEWEDLGNFDGLDRKEAEEKLEISNMKKVYDYLKPRQTDDFVFSKDVFNKIKNTIDLLHKNGFYHRDLHERNIILDKNNEVSLIDFGMSIKNFSGDKKQAYKQGLSENQSTIQDEEIINLLKNLATTNEEKSKVIQERKKIELERLSKRMWRKKIDEKSKEVYYEGDEDFLDLVEEVLDDNEKEEFDFEKYYKTIISNSKNSDEEKLNLLKCFLNDVFSKKEEFKYLKDTINKTEIKEHLIKNMNEEKRPVLKNGLLEIISLLF